MRLSSELCARAEKAFGARFGSLEELIEFMLNELLGDGSIQQDRAEQRMIEERLRDLGYL